MKTFVITSVAAIGILHTTAAAMADETSLPSVGESSVVIVNRANMEIRYSIRPADGQWSDYSLQPGTNEKIVCNQCSTDQFEISVMTNEKQVKYMLNTNSRYSIEWNASAQVWDVFNVPN